MKIIFMGTPQFAEIILNQLINDKHEITLVVTKNDNFIKGKPVFSPVKSLALSNNLKIFQPLSLKHDYDAILDTQADIIITAAYGLFIPKIVLEKFKCINIHGSILPKYRGGAPIQYALFNNDVYTGISIQKMALKMDAGDIYIEETLKIDDNDNYTSLYIRLARLAVQSLSLNLEKIAAGKISAKKQDESKVSFAYTLKKEDEQLKFSTNSALVIHGRVRGLGMVPGAYFKINDIIFKVYKSSLFYDTDNIYSTYESGQVVCSNKKLLIKCANNSIIEILEIQQMGKKIMQVKDFLNGNKVIKQGLIIKENNDV